MANPKQKQRRYYLVTAGFFWACSFLLDYKSLLTFCYVKNPDKYISTKSSSKTKRAILLNELEMSKKVVKRHMPINEMIPIAQPGAIPIISQLSGELGNNLAKIACTRGFQILLKNRYGLETDLKIKHQEKRKWVNGKSDIKSCFPKMADWDFTYANADDFEQIHRAQEKWLERLNIHTPNIKDEIDTWAEYIYNISNAIGGKDPPKDLLLYPNTGFSMPVINYKMPGGGRFFIDNYIHELRDLFQFDATRCCKLTPDPDESVFHFRNFFAELEIEEKRKYKEELSPEKTADELFAHLRPGDKVAITTRFFDDVARSYVDALERRGLTVRVISNQTGTEDFCFLMNAKKELVGSSLSKFFLWAGYLGGADRIRSYSVDSPGRREGRMRRDKGSMNEAAFKPRMFNNTFFRDRFFDELYEAEEMETSDLARAPREIVGNPFVDREEKTQKTTKTKKKKKKKKKNDK